MILLDLQDRRPIYEQITDKLAELMLQGVLGRDDPLPSVRQLAADLSINPNTVQRAYAELERQGYIYSVRTKGSFVSDMEPKRQERQAGLLKEYEKAARKCRQADIAYGRLEEKLREAYGKEEPAAGGKYD